MRFLQIFSGLTVLLLLLPFAAAHAAPPSLDEYENVPPGMLMPQSSAPGTNPVGAPAENAERVMTTEDVIAAYRRGDYALAAKHLEPLAKNGYHPAEELMGIMYRTGQGVPKDPAQALFWLTKAAEARFPLAQHHLANMAFSGEGMAEDPVKALMWLHIAISYYSDGPEKKRALQDRDNLARQLSRRDRDRALLLARAWLEKRGEERRLGLE